MKLTILLIAVVYIRPSYEIRLSRLFQLLEGFHSDQKLQGVLHVGDQYSIYIRAPKPYDKNLVYELYESKNVPTYDKPKPRLMAVSEVPIQYIKDQLKIFRDELELAKFEKNVVPGTQVLTLREWQIDQLLSRSNGKGIILNDSPSVLRTSYRREGSRIDENNDAISLD